MSLRPARSEDPSINLTPMIDVVFLLVIFFLVGSSFGQREGRIQVNIPGVGNPSSLVRGPDKKVVEVTREGDLFLDGKQVSVEQLQSELQLARQSFPDLGVVVRGDGGGTLDTYAKVLNVCSTAGIQRLDVAVKALR